MIKNLLFFLLLIPGTLFAQDKDAQGPIIGLYLSPDYNGLITQNQTVRDEITTKFGFSAGVTFGYRFSKSLNLLSGFGYSNTRFEHHRKSGLTFGTDIDQQFGFLNPDLKSTIASHEFQLPLVLRYYLKGRRVFFAGGGEIEIRYDDSDDFIMMSDGYVIKNGDIQGAEGNIGVLFSIGTTFPVGERYSLTLEPLFRYYFFELMIPDTKMYNVGLRTTMSLNL